MKLIKYEKIGTEVLKDLDLYKVGWRFRYRNLKSLAGYCDYRHKTITLSKHLVLNNSDEKIMNTLIHKSKPYPKDAYKFYPEIQKVEVESEDKFYE